MKYDITSYNFFKTPTGAEFIKGDRIYTISREMLECMLRQYKLIGFKVVFDNECFVSVAKVNNAVEVFLDRLNNKN